MAAFTDVDMNILHINTFVLYACIGKVASLADISLSLLQKLKDLAHVLMVRDVSYFWC